MTSLTGAASFRAQAPGKTARRKQMPVTVSQTSTAAAPVAALIEACSEFPACDGEPMAEIRVFERRFYRQLISAQGQPVGPEGDLRRARPAFLDSTFGTHATEEEAVQAIIDGIGRYLLIDSWFWISVPEPRFCLHEFGVSAAITSDPPTESGAWQTFALTEPDAAGAAALKLAFGNRAAPRVPAASVLIPEAFTLGTSSERIADARRRSAATVTEVAAVLRDGTPAALQKAAQILTSEAAVLSRHTGESRWRA